MNPFLFMNRAKFNRAMRNRAPMAPEQHREAHTSLAPMVLEQHGASGDGVSARCMTFA